MKGAKQIFERNATSLIGEIRANLAYTGANATGKTRDSLEFTASDNQLQIKGDKSYDFVETGRRAGKMPPMQPILEWATARGLIQTESQGRSLVYLIRRSIAERGTVTVSQSKPRDIWTKIVDESTIDSIIDQIQGKALENLLDEFNIVFTK